jgi:hypothetical protein
MAKNNIDLDLIRASRNSGCSNYAKYLLDKSNHGDCLFCFFEGEDFKYYRSRLEKYTSYNYKEIFNYNCNGKKDVLKIFTLIKNNKNELIKKAFFIDKDFDTEEYLDEEIYVTPCYSIENLYTTENAFSKILVSEFGINFFSEDCAQCRADYKDRQEEFHEFVTILNAVIACQRSTECSKNDKLNLSGFKLTKLFSEISIDVIKPVFDITCDSISLFFPEVSIDSEMIETQVVTFNSVDKSMAFRGKFELKFLLNIIDSLRLKNSKKEYFSKKYNCVSINPNINTISVLAPFADTPECLKNFLKRYCIN